MEKGKVLLNVAILVIALCMAGVAYGDPMGTAFTYQGRLYDANSPAEGEYDLEFELYDAPDAGSQQGITVVKDEVEVTDGYFTVQLDFGSDPNCFGGNARWLQMGVRPGELEDPNTYSALSPRQELTPAPYAIYAADPADDGDWTISGDDMYSAVTGNVGIGTTNTDARLTVNGAILRDGSTMYGTGADTHINLGTSCTTGAFSPEFNFEYNTVSGGYDNHAEHSYTTVSGGQSNMSLGYGATVPGGYDNTAGGNYSFAAGRRAKANGNGTFVWADSTDADFSSTADKQFLIRASGGVGIGTDSPSEELEVNGTVKATAFVGDGSGLTSVSVTETDPVFGGSAAAGITSPDITNWNTAYGWGDHASPGYLTSESDPQVGANTTNHVPKWNGSALVTGTIYDNGNVGIGSISPDAKLTVNGAILRDGSTMYGTNADTHINLGTTCTTGESGQNHYYATVGGGKNNVAGGHVAVIGGGEDNTASGSLATISGGYENIASNSYTTVGGGWNNTASVIYATVAGGRDNTSSDQFASIGGGNSNTASGLGSTIGGGENNTASGRLSTVPGGVNNHAGGYYSLSVGRRAKVRDAAASGDSDGDEGTFVWADSTDADFQSTGPDQFLIRASGGVGIGTTSPDEALDVTGAVKVGNTANTNAGAIRWNGTDFEGYDGSQWISLTSSGTGVGSVVQVASYQTGAVATGSTQIPFDDTPPQSSEGDQYMTLSVTPKSATNKLRIDIVAHASGGIPAGSINMTAGLFKDSDTNALAAGHSYLTAGGIMQAINFAHVMTAGSTSAITFKVRVGSDNFATTTFNGTGGNRILGGALASSITITEIAGS